MTSSSFAPAARPATHAAYATTAPGRDEIDALASATVLDFGTDWCGHCQRAQPLIDAAFARHARADAASSAHAPRVRHLKIEDGPGRALGRSFKVKLWPTLIFLREGVEVARVVRPTQADALDDAFAALLG